MAALKISTLQDTFDFLDTGKWNFNAFSSASPGVITAQNSSLHFPCVPVYSGLCSLAAYDLTDSAIFAEIPQCPDPNLATESGLELHDLPNFQSGNNNFYFFLYQGNLWAGDTGPTVPDTHIQIPFDAAAHRWWRIRESAGMVYWEVSPNGWNWTTIRNKIPAFATTALYPHMYTGSDDSSSHGEMVVNGINIPPPEPVIASTDYTDPTALFSALHRSPTIASAAAQVAAKPFLVPDNKITITVYDKIYRPTGEITDHISLEADWKRNDIGTATIVLKGNDPNIAQIMKATTEVVPIVIQVGENLRWSGRVNSYALALDNKNETLTVECVDDFTWFSRILVWPDFLLPIEIQFPKNSIYVGPVVTCVLTMVSEQTFRLQSGLWEFVNDPLELLGLGEEWQFFQERWAAAGGNPAEMLMIPIVVQFVDPLFDTSPWVAIQGRMDKIYDLVKDLLMNYGLSLTASLWLPGDPQPPTESMGLSFIPFPVPLTQPTIVVSCVNRSGVTGPSGLFVDGLVEDAVDLQASLLGTTLSPFLNPKNEYYPANLGVNIAPALGVNFVPSWVVFNADDVNVGGAITYKLSGYAPIAHSIIGGGKSPQWLNDLINATLEFLIDAIEISVGFSGIPDDLLDGTFDDIILAFQQMENLERRAQMGPYGFPEYFTKTGASAYTLDEWFALMQAMFDTSGYNCVQIKWANGYPYTIGKDVFLGSLVSFVRQRQMYTDYVYQITLRDDRKTRAEVSIIVGNGKREVNPILRVVKMVTGLEEVINTISMST